MVRACSEVAFLGFFLVEFGLLEFSSTEFQEREDGCATGLETVGGMNAGGAPRSSAWRSFRARTSSLDCCERVTRSPISTVPPLELSQRHGRTRGVNSKVTEVIGGNL